MDELWAPGVLNDDQVWKLVDERAIDNIDVDQPTFERDIADYSSIDLSLSSEGYEMKLGSIKPCLRPAYITFLRNPSYAERMTADEDCYFTLSRNHCYVFRLQEKLTPALAQYHIFGQATAKSSIGRLDVIARLIVDGQDVYDGFEPSKLQDSNCLMYLEIIPISFDILVKPGDRLCQLRFCVGTFNSCKISYDDFLTKLIHEGDNPNYLSVCLEADDIAPGILASAYRANDRDLRVKISGASSPMDPKTFWTPVNTTSGRLTIQKTNFYILRSKERITLPASVAIYAQAMDETLGEMRIHYAGFVHPFFGQSRPDGKIGTPLIFEVRGHNVDVNLAHAEKLARLNFYRMSRDAVEKEGRDTYSSQELKLSKYFADWTA